MGSLPKEDEPATPATMAINAIKILFAMSPLLALAYVLMTGFEDKEVEGKKRSKKTDFQMDGHAE